MKKLISVFSFLLLLSVHLQASECYHYHTKKYYTLRYLGGKNYLEFKVKDTDEITYVSQERYLITNVNAPLTIVCEDERQMVVKDSQFYYLVSKAVPYQEALTAKKLYAISSVVKVKNSRLISSAGKWYYIVSIDDGKRGFVEVPLGKLPADFEILYAFNRGDNANFLIKNTKIVAAINISIEYKYNICKYSLIRNLDPLTTVFTQKSGEDDNGFLRDNRHFYLIDYDLNLTDVTQQFVNEKKVGFHKMHISWNSFYAPIFSDGSKTLWVYLKEGIGLNDGSNPNFYPIKAEFLNADSVIIKYENKYYNNGWAAAYQVEDIDLPHKGTLLVPRTIQRLPAIDAYGAHTPALVLGPGFILPEDSENKISRKSVVKFLVKAYAFDDQLFIENRLIKNPGNRNKMSFVGALADVIVPCDGGRGQHSVVVEYNYFFKDDHAVYAYHSKQKSLQVLKDFKPNDIKIDDFDDLQKLVKKVLKKY